MSLVLAVLSRLSGSGYLVASKHGDEDRRYGAKEKIWPNCSRRNSWGGGWGSLNPLLTDPFFGLPNLGYFWGIGSAHNPTCILASLAVTTLEGKKGRAQGIHGTGLVDRVKVLSGEFVL